VTGNWLEICRQAVGDLRGVLEQLPTRETREPITGRGVGGDDTTAIDAAAEAAIVRRLEEAHERGLEFRLVSEELGERIFGGQDMTVVVDPIDGSVNAKRGIPFFAFSLAVADGGQMGDVEYGYVYDLGSGEEWTALKGGGAFLNGERLGGVRPKDDIELLQFEATVTDLVADRIESFRGIAERVRVMGSLALSLCHLAAGRVDAVCSLKPARSVDIAAAQLLIRECGLAVDLPEAPPFERAPLDLEGRSRIVAAGTQDGCRRIAEALLR
jgi:myo-inositol-1(or 4)-monophosphatase